MIPLLLTAALAKTPPITVELSDASPASGDRVFVRMSWTNDSSEPVRVPADLLDRFVIRALVEVPWEPTNATAYVERPAEAATERAASSLAWQTVPAFGTLERISDLAEFVPQCRDGCATGDYQLHARLDVAPVTGLAGDQQVPPPGSWDWNLQIRAPQMPVARAEAARLDITGLDIDKDGVATIQVRVHNLLDWDAYFPDAEARLTTCLFTWPKGNTTLKASERQTNSNRMPWHESDALLVPKGEAVDTTITCSAGKAPAANKDLTVTVTVRPRSPFVPLKRARTPFWFAGEVSGTASPNRKN
jgi:hypothetical protein